MGSQASTQKSSQGNTPIDIKTQKNQSLSPTIQNTKPISSKQSNPSIKEKKHHTKQEDLCIVVNHNANEKQINLTFQPNLIDSDTSQAIQEQSTILNKSKVQNKEQSSNSSIDSNIQINEDLTIDFNNSRNKPQLTKNSVQQINEPIVIAICDEIYLVDEQHYPSHDIAIPYQKTEIFVNNLCIANIWKKLGPYRVINSTQQPFIYPNKDIYIGEWMVQQRNGYGRFITNEILYEGYWQNDQYANEGRIIYNNGDVYVGEFQKGKYNGDGKYISNDGLIYEGEWMNGKRNGMGKEIMPDGSVFIGTFYNNVRNGKGKLYNNTECNVFEGEWIDGKVLEKGTLVWQDGRKYQGEWKNGMMHGKGTFIWPEGKKYIGNYINNVRNGYGEYYYADGKIYKGIWKDGLMNGQGIIIYPNNSHEKGMWNKGKRIEAKLKNESHQQKKIILPL